MEAMHDGPHTQGHTAQLRTDVIRELESGSADHAATPLIIQKVFRAVMSHVPLWMLFTYRHLSARRMRARHMCVRV